MAISYGQYVVPPGYVPPLPLHGEGTPPCLDRAARENSDTLFPVYDAPPLIQAASLYLSLLAVTRSDATLLSSEDPKAGRTSAPPACYKGLSATDLLGEDGIALIRHYWPSLAPLRASKPARSIAQCDTCAQFVYIPGGTTKPPRACTMTLGCTGTMHKAYVRPNNLELRDKERRKEELKKKKAEPKVLKSRHKYPSQKREENV